MQIDFTPEQEAQLSQIANHNGVEASVLVQQAALRMLQDEAEFQKYVQQGIDAADRGEFVEHAEVWKNLQTILKR